eukprot:3680188-Rhodomonas_salina.1
MDEHAHCTASRVRCTSDESQASGRGGNEERVEGASGQCPWPCDADWTTLTGTGAGYSPKEQWSKVWVNGKVNVWDYDGETNLCAGCNDEFMQHPRTLDGGLIVAEVVALRLYTSPMYRKYQEELRGLLNKYTELKSKSARAHGAGEQPAPVEER